MHAPALAAATLTLAVACACLPAAAQVVRCTDAATGKVTYTDGACHRGDVTREVEARKTPEEIAQERQQAAEALERKHERQQQEARLRREADQAERAAFNAQPAPRSDPANSAQCQRARKQLQDTLASMGQGMYDEQSRLDTAQRQADLACLSPADYARTEGSRAYRPAYAPPYYGPPVTVIPPRRMPPGPALPAPRRDIVNCNVFRCYDGQGNTYPR
ncbi:MAG: DUF4124 domain-containing protein [Proteobacteria bacterium]|nr:DUF4124 domain-containing protein [Pseudomonadota bacterium]MBS0492955.1 DUF4124 domain-containing protein [Pseudomonadota bacterium]